ncbi:septum formation protein [Cognatiyoonia sediminum]|uniref:dTTP/UTP pyrophosphatase n=1 Tax=Cognatiyoonia sediminum TaxID=1508389 RepID=A0A1M5SLL4_9RHOB|nr:nucleoside triphosphate pyrophosphatase [Cognatiyoonia sediminum]SHH39404.1 septum formation protein [Cognatiyoonia sediminum]
MTALPPDPNLKLILGSGSPRRRELIGQLGLVAHDVRAPDIDEDVRAGEKPRDYVNRIALEKARTVSIADDEVVLCADTTVALGRRIMGKPEDASQAGQFLRAMSGRRHQVITALAVRREERMWQRDVVSQVKMKALSDREIGWYLATGDWQGKAGGYGIQGPASAFIPWIGGSFHAVMGLPLPETAALLTAAGLPVMEIAP